MEQNGLTKKQASELLEKFGPNEIQTRENDPWFLIFFSQFKSPLIYILVIIGSISLFFKDFTETILILAVVFLNVFMGFFQEHSAKKTLLALGKILQDKIIVIRDNQRQEIEAKYLVPGDIVVLGAGDKVPADGKIIEGKNLLVSEAILTGEEEAVPKAAEEGKNLVFMGTTIISGRDLMMVQKTGLETEIGKISRSLSKIKEEKTPLQVKLEKFSRSLGLIILGASFFIFAIGLLNGKDVWEMLKISIVLAVAAIPEGLPIAITVILSLGMRRILAKNGLVKKLLAIETLGSTSVICTDKTGTLTEGNMRVSKANFINEELALATLIFANGRRSNIETALWDFAVSKKSASGEEALLKNSLIHEEPFDSEKKYAMSIRQNEGGLKTAYLLGAPEIILKFCDSLPENEIKITKEIKEWGSEGLKILGIATKSGGELAEKSGFSWQGLIAISDPLRPEAKEMVEMAKRAGIKVKIVTGDYQATAEKISSLLGFSLKKNNIMSGKELGVITNDELKKRIGEIDLFARVSPGQKQKIISALQEQGEVVAMTGDGVNDAPALKKADIGVVMSTGSDVAKEAGDLILLDNNFKTIISACEEGRLIFANIKKVVGYALSNSFVEIVLIFGAMLAGLPAPLTVAQILWIHLICDGPPDIMLSFEPKERGLMRESPRNIRREKILDRPMKFLIFAISLATGLLALYFFWRYLAKTADITLARTIAFATAGAADLIYIFAFKSNRRPILETANFFKNKFLFWGVGYGFVLLFAAIYLPFLNQILNTKPLQAFYWVLIFSAGIFAVLITEVVKFFRRSAREFIKRSLEV